VSEGVGVPGVAGVLDASGIVLDEDDDGEAGAGVLIGAASLGALDVAGVAGVSPGFLQPARAANTTTVANIVLRINIGPPFVVKNVFLRDAYVR
jgi:proteasome assembly chaperone (PAC2) family protein